MKQRLSDLREQSLGIMFLCCRLLLMSQYILDFLHTQTMLIEQRGAGMASHVPMDIAVYAHMPGKGSQVMICLIIAAYICQTFQRPISSEDSERLPCKKSVKRENERMPGLSLAEIKRTVLQAIGRKLTEIAPAKPRIAAEQESIAYMTQAGT